MLLDFDSSTTANTAAALAKLSKSKAARNTPSKQAQSMELQDQSSTHLRPNEDDAEDEYEEIEYMEEVLDMGSVEKNEKFIDLQQRCRSMYADMRVRPLNLLKLRPAELKGNELGRIPRNIHEACLFSSIDYQYLDPLMTDADIEMMPDRENEDFWLEPGYSKK